MKYSLQTIKNSLNELVIESEDDSEFIISSGLIETPLKACVKDSNGIFQMFDFNTIVYFEANKKRTKIYFEDESTMSLNIGIGKIETALEDSPLFARVQKKYIINLVKVKWYDPVFRSIGINIGKQKKQLPVGLGFQSKFEENLFTYALDLNSTTKSKAKKDLKIPVKSILSSLLFLDSVKDKFLDKFNIKPKELDINKIGSDEIVID